MRRKHSVYANLVIDRHCCLKLNYVEEDQDYTTAHWWWKCHFNIQSNVIHVAFFIIIYEEVLFLLTLILIYRTL